VIVLYTCLEEVVIYACENRRQGACPIFLGSFADLVGRVFSPIIIELEIKIPVFSLSFRPMAEHFPQLFSHAQSRGHVHARAVWPSASPNHQAVSGFCLRQMRWGRFITGIYLETAIKDSRLVSLSTRYLIASAIIYDDDLIKEMEHVALNPIRYS
jgi:hypothetical protein